MVQKLLGLLSDAHEYDEEKTQLSLKSVAEMLYTQQQCTDSGNDTEQSHSDQLYFQHTVTGDVVTSTANVCQISPSSCTAAFPLSLTTSHNTVMDHICDAELCWSDTVNSQNTRTPTAPYFCVPTVPVLSPVAPMHKAHRTLHEQSLSMSRQNICCGDSIDMISGNLAFSAASAHHNSAVTSTCFMTLLPNVQPLHSCPTAPRLLSSQSVLYSDGCPSQQTDYRQGSGRVLWTAAEAVSRMSSLLSAHCRVLVLMRGCPGSGKTTMAM